MDAEKDTAVGISPQDLTARTEVPKTSGDESLPEHHIIKIETEETIIYEVPPEKKWAWGLHQFNYVFFTVYRRLFAAVVLANLVGFLAVLGKEVTIVDDLITDITTAAAANICVAILVRQEYIINLFHKACACTPLWAPLWFRRMMAKVYEFGGVHSGASFCSVMWFIFLTVVLTKNYASYKLHDTATLVLAFVLVALFIGIMTFAYPKLRSLSHNTFERSHRFMGWLCIILFWTFALLSANAIGARPDDPRDMGQVLYTQPSFYFLTITTIHIILPWSALRKLEATPEVLSEHALRLHIKPKIPPFYILRISDSPLSEWHSFACFPDKDPVDGNRTSLVISKAGDWTSKTIASPLTHYFTRGTPTIGVLFMAQVFKRVVVVTTGSGVGPCLSLLAKDPSKRPQCRVLWSTPRPQETFGEEISRIVMEADPKAMIIDTKKQKRPDMLALTWQLVKESNAEAAFVISNPGVTKSVVYGLECRGVAAYGPIWDS